MIKYLRLSGLVLAGAFLFAACTPDARQETQDAAQEIGEDLQQGANQVGQAADNFEDQYLDSPQTVVLAEVNNSGVAGTASMIRTDDGQTQVDVMVDQGDLAGTQMAGIHAGTCDDLGEELYELDALTDGESSTTLSLPYEQVESWIEGNQQFAVVVMESTAPESVIACGGAN